MYDNMRRILQSGRYSTIEEFTLPAREPRYSAIPTYLDGCRVGAHLRELHPNGLWLHQAEALSILGKGQNVVVSTGTASGKSLIFRSHAFHRVLTNSQSRVLVFYPLKALASDQYKGWREIAAELSVGVEAVGKVDGSVAVTERDAILERSRIVVMTPDVCHAWMMSRMAIPVVKDFIRSLDLIVLDEAHTLEGVFGSNFAFLIRRLLSARNFLKKNVSDDDTLQFIAATATISNPIEHLKALTGRDFALVPEELDGSPQSERLCVHIGCPLNEEITVAKEIQAALLSGDGVGGFITFLDSRKGVELLARASQGDIGGLASRPEVMPYRAGYDVKDREAIEARLQTGSLRGIVSTSALELGINIPHLTVGMNVGVPATRKAYRQRLGRVGRSSTGIFLILGEPTAFTAFGTSYREYHDLSVEPSYLYLDNRFMQYAHARCLADELESLGASQALPGRVGWPHGFAEIFASAKPGGNRPAEYDAIAQLGGDSPQRNYPLRNVGEINFKIARGENQDSAFGDVNEAQALRECYPGATYWHMANSWEVISWHTNAFIPFIKVRPASHYRQTRPRMRTWINTGIAPQDLMEGHFKQGPSGFIAECQMQITEKVEGYTELPSGVYRSYVELRQKNPNLRPRMRNFRTSGVVLCIKESWFKQAGTKQWLADKLVAIFTREYSVQPQDIGSAATNISVRTNDGGGLRGDCIAIFDQTYGSLRLTEKLFLEFEHLLSRLEVAVQAEDGDYSGDEYDMVSQLAAIYEQFVPVSVSSIAPPNGTVRGHLQCFTPGSIVCYREKGKITTEVEILQPTLMNGHLMYQVKSAPKDSTHGPVKNWIAAEYLEPSADASAWEYAWWNSEAEIYQEPDELEQRDESTLEF